MEPVTIRAYAKINLGLRIYGKRPDGYHEIETVYHMIDLFDELKFEPWGTIEVSNSDPALPRDEGNLCYRAATLLQEHLGLRHGVRISLTKNIPIGAGLGGGSSDAGAVMRELPRFWNVSIERKELSRLALMLGSDVPYFLHNGSAFARGRGEILEYFQLELPYAVLLCYPNIHISTAWAYNKVRTLRTRPDECLKDALLNALTNPTQLFSCLANDFEPIVFETHPEILQVKESMIRNGAQCAALSGSGSSVFGLFSQIDKALNAAELLRNKRYKIFISSLHFSVP